MTDPDADGGEDEIIATDFSLGGEHRESAYADHVEPDPISADAYFALTDEEKREVHRDGRGLPIGYWFWQQEARKRYATENPTQEAPPRVANGKLHGFNPADWEGKTAPERMWIVIDYIPDRTVTLLYADGGTGKSYLKLQLAVARALAKEWIGLLPVPGRTLVLPQKTTLMRCGDESRACCPSSARAWRTWAISGLSILSVKIPCSACFRKASSNLRQCIRNSTNSCPVSSLDSYASTYWPTCFPAKKATGRK
jgi:AAA domain